VTKNSEVSVTTGKHYFIEPTDDGKYAVRAKGSQRASKKTNTQKQAEAVVKKLNPDDKPNIARVEVTKRGHPDQWRKE
jgi:predicted peptidase